VAANGRFRTTDGTSGIRLAALLSPGVQSSQRGVSRCPRRGHRNSSS
jgi:hypothetical protein